MRNSSVPRPTATGRAADEASTSQPPRGRSKLPLYRARNATYNIRDNNNQSQLRATSEAPPERVQRVPSDTSLMSRRSDAVETPGKPKQKLGLPRSNQLTEQRMIFTRNYVEKVANKNCLTPLPPINRRKPSVHRSLTDIVAQEHRLEVEALQRQLEELQSKFMKAVASPRHQGPGCTYKLVTIVHADTSKLLVHPDDLLRLPRNLPAKSAGDLKKLFHEVFETTIKTISDKIMHILMLRDDEMGAQTCQGMFCMLQPELNKKRQVVDDEILKLCADAADKKDDCIWNSQRKQLETTNSAFKAEIDFLQRKEEQAINELKEVKERCSDLTKQLAERDAKIVKSTKELEQLLEKIKQSEHVNSKLQTHLKETMEKLEQSKQSFSKHESHWQQETADHELLKKQYQTLEDNLNENCKKIEENVEVINLKDNQIATQLQTLLGLESEMIVLKQQLSIKESELDQMKQSQETVKPELQQKINLLEQQEKEHRQILANKDKELKAQEQEIKRLKCENMAQISEKNTIINQIKNELASSNEQYQSLCETLTFKEKMMRRHEQEIQLLEESHERQKLRNTNLGEKNATLEGKVLELRSDLAKYAAILTGNNGQCLFEPVSAEVALKERLRRHR